MADEIYRAEQVLKRAREWLRLAATNQTASTIAPVLLNSAQFAMDQADVAVDAYLGSHVGTARDRAFRFGTATAELKVQLERGWASLHAMQYWLNVARKNRAMGRFSEDPELGIAFDFAIKQIAGAARAFLQGDQPTAPDGKSWASLCCL